jgi:hypothetical protein
MAAAAGRWGRFFFNRENLLGINSELLEIMFYFLFLKKRKVSTF